MSPTPPTTLCAADAALPASLLSDVCALLRALAAVMDNDGIREAAQFDAAWEPVERAFDRLAPALVGYVRPSDEQLEVPIAQAQEAGAWVIRLRSVLSRQPEFPATYFDGRCPAVEPGRTQDLRAAARWASREAAQAVADGLLGTLSCMWVVEQLADNSAPQDGRIDPAEALPVKLLLFCPACFAQHVDTPNAARGWTNPPHRSHECQSCGYVWRPADVPTEGVAALHTRGKRDGTPVPNPALTGLGSDDCTPTAGATGCNPHR